MLSPPAPSQNKKMSEQKPVGHALSALRKKHANNPKLLAELEALHSDMVNAYETEQKKSQ